MINRIILIGNGFDLAHDMKTTYRQFIDDYWENITSQYCKSDDNTFECSEFSMAKYLSKSPLRNFTQFMYHVAQNRRSFVVKNPLFLELSKLNAESWVDIESDYYRRLKKSAKENQDNRTITKLNEYFENIKILLENYLTKQLIEKKHRYEVNIRSIYDNLYEPINLRDLSEYGLNNITDYFWNRIKKYAGSSIEIQTLQMSDLTLFEKNILNKQNSHMLDRDYLFRYLKTQVLKNTDFDSTFLSFNYTNTEKYYANGDDEIIHIHGELHNKLNPMIFGYGDELDDDYKLIEKLDDNDFLDNVKSTNYAKTDNYKRLLQTTNSGIYQVYIIGHSCGNTDRTLLNTIFEHDNCVSVKIFYHERGKDDDNYLDIYKNISRNFNDKAKLRDRVVNKSYSKPLIPFVPE